MAGGVVLLVADCASEAEAKRIARALARRRLAACVNVYPRVRSVYRWKERVEEASEAVLVAKTMKSRAAAATARIKALHSYDLPSILAVDAAACGGAVAAWFKESVKRKRKTGVG